MVTSSTQLQNSHFTSQKERERLRNVKNENCTCKACKTIVFQNQICKFVTFLLPSSSYLRKLPIDLCGVNDTYSHRMEGKQILNQFEIVFALLLQRSKTNALTPELKFLFAGIIKCKET